MDLIDVLHQVAEDTMSAYGLSDMAVGTVTSADPLEVTIRESMAPLPQAVLWLTASVIERKIPVVAHKHTTTGFRHSHMVPACLTAMRRLRGPQGPRWTAPTKPAKP